MQLLNKPKLELLNEPSSWGEKWGEIEKGLVVIVSSISETSTLIRRLK